MAKPAHLHFLGICGTFMGSLAQMARSLGFKVSGSDVAFYPPISDVINSLDIEVVAGYDKEAILALNADVYIVGNVMKRGQPIIEYILNERLPYTSGPEWLYQNILKKRRVIAVCGTHGKTTTTSLLTHLFKENNRDVGYLIGGVPIGFESSSSVGTDELFIIEGDEYDTAFFDKRSKFLHYHPEICIVNNLEFDHADIFPNLDAIITQFHYMIRKMPSTGKVVYHQDTKAIERLMSQGCWSEKLPFSLHQPCEWEAQLKAHDGSRFECLHNQTVIGEASWACIGEFNVHNAMAAMLAAHAAGLSMDDIVHALSTFKGVKRRQELVFEHQGIRVYDDFAHHPTEMASTLSAMRLASPDKELVGVVEVGSNSMRSGTHLDELPKALKHADRSFVYCDAPEARDIIDGLGMPNVMVTDDMKVLLAQLCQTCRQQVDLVVMSNRGFNGLHAELKAQLRSAA